ncbi:MAG: citryl-CoA lyase [Candidatus Woesearchaeota archaeon]
MEFKTSISKITEDDMILRGEKHSDLINTLSFSDTIFLLLTSKKPEKTESNIFSAILTSCIDHGMGTTSSLTARTVMSGGNNLNTAVGAGILALGKYHGGAIEGCMNQLIEIKNKNVPTKEYVKQMLDNKKTILGFGHKVYKKQDPRVVQLLEIAKKNNITSENNHHVKTVLEIEQAIEEIKGKKLILNVDGLIAALLLEMNFTPEQGNGVFIIARTPGLTAQAIEEKQREKPVRRINEEDIVYDGK